MVRMSSILSAHGAHYTPPYMLHTLAPQHTTCEVVVNVAKSSGGGIRYTFLSCPQSDSAPSTTLGFAGKPPCTLR
eukprot:NODE_8820_length_278_cov_41.917031_g8080_i0.p2 GENE.NODE_8820_length_278_cov_41.917031_g8080_i0~~NODE_8820_length_278_cov_41.917031_g8080_i0.p2  ORF type:complete len:75 (-),score=15.61 NODE_8820_length_278_cov_41.917031_g8080_i0:3-227(-)